jgi:hypothetical protein
LYNRVEILFSADGQRAEGRRGHRCHRKRYIEVNRIDICGNCKDEEEEEYE